MGVSVIIPCRNQASTLERAVKSAFAVGADEVLVFDDASTDNSNIIAREIECKYRDSAHNFVLLNTYAVRMGVSHARNDLIIAAHNDWIIPLDADDELLPSDTLIHSGGLRLAWDVDTDFYYGGWIEHYTDGHEETFKAPPAAMLNRKPLCHATMMFSKQQWQTAGGYDSDFFFGEDYAFQCALVNVGFKPSQQYFPMYKRYVSNNPRTNKAMKYWPIIQEMAKEKYPAVFS